MLRRITVHTSWNASPSMVAGHSEQSRKTATTATISAQLFAHRAREVHFRWSLSLDRAILPGMLAAISRERCVPQAFRRSLQVIL